MRRPVLLAFFIIFILTLIVWGVSYFLQPYLPTETNKAIGLFFDALVGVAGVLGIVGFIEFFVKLIGKNKSGIKEVSKTTAINKHPYQKDNNATEKVKIQTGDIEVENGKIIIVGRDYIQSKPQRPSWRNSDATKHNDE